jgi:hypothetical protein
MKEDGKTDRFTQAERLLREQGYRFDPVAFRWTREAAAAAAAGTISGKHSASTGPSRPDFPPLYHVCEYISQAIAIRQPYDRTPRMCIVGAGCGSGAADLIVEFEGARYSVQIKESGAYANAAKATHGTGDTGAGSTDTGDTAAEAEARDTESLAHKIEALEVLSKTLHLRFSGIVELRNDDVRKVNAMNQQILETMTQLSASIAEVRELNRSTNVRVTALEDEHAKTRQIMHDVNTQHGGLSGRVNDLERMALARRPAASGFVVPPPPTPDPDGAIRSGSY